MAVLMLCNTPVYDITNDVILSKIFCPFPETSLNRNAYKRWRANRVYLRSNRIAERIIQQAGGIGTREAKRRMSLSDGYWVRYSYDEKTSFESITPYLNSFSEARVVRGSVHSSSVPELVVGGSQPKLWARGSDGITYLRKSELPEQIKAELLAVKLIRKCGVGVMNAFIQTNEGKVYADNYSASQDLESIGVINLVNMTSVNRSLIHFDQMGINVNGYSPVSVTAGYKQAGVTEDVIAEAITQVVVDAVVGNTDRKTNNSNWAIFMDNRTGKHEPSKMYDFNWAVYAEAPEQITEVSGNIKKAGIEIIKTASEQAARIHDACKELGLTPWQENAQLLYELLL